MSNRKGKELNSLDLIEDCLSKIYWARKANLLARAKRFKEKRELQETKRTGGNLFTADNDNNLFEENENRIVDDKEVEKHSPGKRPVKFSQTQHLLDDSIRKNEPLPTNHIQYSELRKDGKESNKHDLIAIKLYEDFLNDVTNWHKNNAKGVNDENLRGDFADFMVDKYLTSKLDIYERSELVALVRRQISNDIESLASDGNIPTPNEEILLRKEEAKPLEPVNHQKDHPKQDMTFPHENASMSASPTKSYLSKNTKIQKQLETYQQTKKKVEFHPDVKTLQEYTELNDDIKSLLSALQKKQPVVI